MIKHQNFTCIKDSHLLAGFKYEHVLYTLLFYRVMKTSELINKSGYKSGVNSFRKLIQRLVKKNLIGLIQFEKFSEYYLYPKVLLLKIYKVKNWRPLEVDNNSFERLLLFYQTSLIAQTIGTFCNSSQLKCHLDPSKNAFEFAFEPENQTHKRLAIYTYLEGEDANFLERIGNTVERYSLDGILVVHRLEFSGALNLLKDDIVKLLKDHTTIFYLTLEKDAKSILQVSNLIIDSIEGPRDFKSFFKGGFEDVGRQIYSRTRPEEKKRQKELEQKQSPTFWGIFKGALD